MELLENEAMALEDNHQPWSEIDYSTCKRYGPSYHALPVNVCTFDIVLLDVYAVLFLLFMLNVYSSICSVSTPKCSGRTELCWRTLNNISVSVPTGSEDFAFENQRKNQYEEGVVKMRG